MVPLEQRQLAATQTMHQVLTGHLAEGSVLTCSSEISRERRRRSLQVVMDAVSSSC